MIDEAELSPFERTYGVPSGLAEWQASHSTSTERSHECVSDARGRCRTCGEWLDALPGGEG